MEYVERKCEDLTTKAANESTHSLSQWKVNFKQYCKKDEAFKVFLAATTKWDFTKENAGFVASIGSRNPQTLKEDLEDFVLMLASYRSCQQE